MTDSAAAPLPSTPLIPVFYTRASCKLCQQAEALLRAWEVPFQRVDIAGDEDLIARYGHHVPVLTLPLATLPVVLPLVAVVVPWVARLDRRMSPPLGSRHNGPLAAVAMLLLTGSLVLVWRHGLVVHPAAPLSSLGVLGVWLGSWLLARASNWRP